MYFDNNFPTIVYDSAGDGTFKDVKNLLRRVALNTKVKTNTLLYDTYDVKEGETPEMIAHKVYGDPELHWIILLINEVTDRYHQWPMSLPQFQEYLAALTDPWWFIRKNPPINVVSDNESGFQDRQKKLNINSNRTVYPVHHYAWDGSLLKHGTVERKPTSEGSFDEEWGEDE